MLSFTLTVAVHAQEHVTPLKTGGDIVTFPSVTRVIGGFVLTVALAVGAAYGLKRYLPRFARRFPAITNPQLTAQSSAVNGVRYHVVTIAGETVLVAEGKTGIAMAVLPKQPTQAPSPP